MEPKCPMAAYLIWLKRAKKRIKAKNPTLNATEIAKKGGEMWKAMKDKSVWQEKAVEAYYNMQIASESKSISDGTDKPKRPMSAYMMWQNKAKKLIKAENPTLNATEIAKKGGEMWKAMKDKSVWQEKAAKAREQCNRDLKLYNKTNIIPKRPMSAAMMWLSWAKKRIKAENPGLSIPEIAKKGGKMWRTMKDKSVWQEKAAKARQQYRKDLTSYDEARVKHWKYFLEISRHIRV